MTRRTTTDASFVHTRRPRFVGAVAALALVVAGCAVGTTTSEGDVRAPLTASTTQAASTSQPVSTEQPSSEAATSPPEALLAGALGAYADGYRFAATARVNGEVATAIDGRWSEGSAEMSIRSGDGEVEYVITPAGQWVRIAAGQWQELDGDPPVANPLATLAAPTTLERIDGADGEVVLRAMYRASMLGLDGEDDILVDLVLSGARLVQAGYQRQVGPNAIETVTTFAPAEAFPPITTPPAAGSG